MTDPFRPLGAARRFPRERLLRAGITDGTVDQLAERWVELSPAERTSMSAFVDSRSDEAIRERFDAPVTRESLDDLNVDELRDRLRERDLSTAGRKADLVARLAEALGITADAPADPVDAAIAAGAATTPADPVEQTDDTVDPAAGPEPLATVGGEVPDSATAGGDTA